VLINWKAILSLEWLFFLPKINPSGFSFLEVGIHLQKGKVFVFFKITSKQYKGIGLTKKLSSFDTGEFYFRFWNKFRITIYDLEF